MPPSIAIRINSATLNANATANLTYGSLYQLSCTANGSRPAVALKFNANGLDLSNYSNTTVTIVSSYSLCDFNSTMCTSELVINLQMNDYRLQTIQMLTCQAVNTTYPYNLSSSLSTNVQVLATASNQFY